jgi:hypothetical protein
MTVTETSNLIMGSSNRASQSSERVADMYQRVDLLDITEYLGAFEQDLDINFASRAVA